MNPVILLVDIASANREELKSFLQNQKCDVGAAADGESAVRLCQQMQPDLVLLHDGLKDTTRPLTSVAQTENRCYFPTPSTNSRKSRSASVVLSYMPFS